jgi:hypothetical protein
VRAALRALGAIVVAAAALTVQAGCSGILGLSPGTASDGGLGEPCDTISDTPTPCGASDTVCVLNLCRTTCFADSDCPSDARCIVADGSNENDNGGNVFGGGNSLVYGCVPLDATACMAAGCPSPDVCDPSGQCRTSCSSTSNGCAHDQSCESVGGSLACYGPHDPGFEGPDGSVADDASAGDSGEDVTTSGSACTGTPSYVSCAECASNGCSCPGCATSTGTCSGTTYTCTQCGTSYGCSPKSCPDCVAGPEMETCTGSTLYASCSECPQVYCGNTSTYAGYCPGCTLSGGTCSGADPACSSFTDPTTCAEEGCEYSGSTTCTGTLTPCSANVSPAACENQLRCTWTTTDCTGTMQPCSNVTSENACETQAGCSWLNEGNACSGTLTSCASLSESMCSSQPGCTWSDDAGPEEAGSGCDDASGSDGGVCNCLSVTGPAIDVVASSGIPSIPNGGTIATGTYVLTSVSYYEPGGSVPSGSTVGTGQSTVVVTGSSWQQVIVMDGGTPATSSGTFSTSGADLTLSESCPDTTEEQWEYTASGSTLILYVPYEPDGGPSGILVETFTSN